MVWEEVVLLQYVVGAVARTASDDLFNICSEAMIVAYRCGWHCRLEIFDSWGLITIHQVGDYNVLMKR